MLVYLEVAALIFIAVASWFFLFRRRAQQIPQPGNKESGDSIVDAVESKSTCPSTGPVAKVAESESQQESEALRCADEDSGGLARNTSKAARKPPTPPPRRKHRKHKRQLSRETFRRSKLIDEIVETESSYCADLNLIVQDFLKPLRGSRPPVLSQDKIQKIFSNVEILRNLNLALLDDLKRSVENPAASGNLIEKACAVGEVFIRFSPFLKSYSEYCANFATAQEVLEDELHKNHIFHDFVEKHSTATRGLRLASFLIKPVQRITKYPLLFRELLKHTPDVHPKIGKLREVAELAKAIAADVDKLVTAHEQQAKTFLLYEALDGRCRFMLEPQRYLLHWAVCRVASQRRRRARSGVTHIVRPAMLILMTDLVVLARPSRSVGLGGKHARRKLKMTGRWRFSSMLWLNGVRIVTGSEERRNAPESPQQLVQRDMAVELEENSSADELECAETNEHGVDDSVLMADDSVEAAECLEPELPARPPPRSAGSHGGKEAPPVPPKRAALMMDSLSDDLRVRFECGDSIPPHISESDAKHSAYECWFDDQTAFMEFLQMCRSARFDCENRVQQRLLAAT